MAESSQRGKVVRAASLVVDLGLQGSQQGRDRRGSAQLAIDGKLADTPGKQLVFVRYSPRHLLRTWVHNDADIDHSRIVWALDRGEDNAALLRYYPDRTAWLVEPDSVPPRLTRYPRD